MRTIILLIDLYILIGVAIAALTLNAVAKEDSGALEGFWFNFKVFALYALTVIPVMTYKLARNIVRMLRTE